MLSTKYIGMDVHRESISIAVLNSAGKLVMECVIETKASTIIDFIDGQRGNLQVTFEEGTWAAWCSFWSLNIGLAWMVFSTLFPLGILQLYHSVSAGYFDARSLEFLSNRTNSLLEWLRLPGDTLFILGGLCRLYIWYGSACVA